MTTHDEEQERWNSAGTTSRSVRRQRMTALSVAQVTILKTARACSDFSPTATIHPHETHLGLDAKFIKETDYLTLKEAGLIEGTLSDGFRITQHGRDALEVRG